MKLSILFLLFLTSCGSLEYSPWQSDPPTRDLTAKHLAWLDRSNDSFTPFKFVLSGDSQAVIGHFDNMIQVSNALSDIDFVTVAGDLTDLGFNKEFELFNKALKNSNKPVITVVGNHDGLNNGDKLYTQMFGPLNYTFMYKDVKFIMWNNNAYEWQVDFDFLETELKSNTRTILIAHQPPYAGTLTPTQESRWRKIRKNPNLIASLHGHQHRQFFSKEDGLPIFIVERVTNSNFAIVEVTSSGVKISGCSSLCKFVGEGER